MVRRDVPRRDADRLPRQYGWFAARASGGVLFFQVGNHYDLLDGQARKHAARLGLREIPPRPGFRRRAGFPLRHLTRFVDAARRLELAVTVVIQQPGAFAVIRRRRLGFRVVPGLPSGREKENRS